MSDYRNLIAWREAMILAECVYHDTENFPGHEIFGLRAQIRRAAVSVPTNLAEGSGRNSSGEMRQLVGYACASLAELETQLELAVRLGFLAADASAIGQADRVAKLASALRRFLSQTDAASHEKRVTKNE